MREQRNAEIGVGFRCTLHAWYAWCQQLLAQAQQLIAALLCVRRHLHTSCGGLDAYTATQLGCWCCDKADEPGSAQDTEAGAHTHEALPAHVEFILLDDHISHVGMQVGNSYVATERSM